MTTLIPVIAGLGLAVAFTSPGSVVTMIVLLSMSSPLRRAIAFICGWVLAIGVLALLMIFVLHGQDFSSKHTAPSQTASIVEIVLGRADRGRRRTPLSTAANREGAGVSAEVARPGRARALVAVRRGRSRDAELRAHARGDRGDPEGERERPCRFRGGAGLRRHVDRDHLAPVVVVVAAPRRSSEVLASWRAWLVGNSRSIALIALMAIGAILVLRGAYDLAA